MLYNIKYKLGYITNLITKNDRKDYYEIYIYGKRFFTYNGKGVWRGVGPARLAIRNSLNFNSYYRFIYEDEVITDKDEIIEDIIKNKTGTSPSFPIYIKRIDD